MNLEQQIQELVDGAPQDGVTANAVKAIAPVLSQIAERLKRTQYYVLQTLEQQWVVTTLSSQTQPEIKKNVVYAFSSHRDASASSAAWRDTQMMALPTPVIQLLFQILALNGIDSVIFFDTPDNIETGTEIRRQEIQNLIQIQLQQTSLNRNNNLPPDIA